MVLASAISGCNRVPARALTSQGGASAFISQKIKADARAARGKREKEKAETEAAAKVKVRTKATEKGKTAAVAKVATKVPRAAKTEGVRRPAQRLTKNRRASRHLEPKALDLANVHIGIRIPAGMEQTARSTTRRRAGTGRKVTVRSENYARTRISSEARAKHMQPQRRSKKQNRKRQQKPKVSLEYVLCEKQRQRQEKPMHTWHQWKQRWPQESEAFRRKGDQHTPRIFTVRVMLHLHAKIMAH